MGDDVEIRVTAQDDASDVLQGTTKQINSMGDAAKANQAKMNGLGDAIQSVGSVAARSHPGVEKYGTGLDSVGNRADEVDTRMLGLADGISGVSDVMKGPGEVGAAGFAMGLADIGSSVFNFVIPSIKGLADGLGPAIQKMTGATTTMGGLGRAAVMAGGVAGVGALLMAINQAGKAAEQARFKELADDFIATGESAAIAAVMTDKSAFSMNDLRGTFEKLLEQSPDLARKFIDVAEAEGLSSEMTVGMREELRHTIDVQEGLAEATEKTTRATYDHADGIRSVSDAINASMDPLFGVIDAQQRLAEAQAAVNLAEEEHGRNSPQAVAASIAVAEAALGQESAMSELRASVQDGTTSVGQAIRKLDEWVRAGAITREDAERTKAAFYGVRDAVNSIPGSRTVHVNYVRSQEELLAGYAHGGIVGAATGGIHGGWRMVGEHGPELAQLPPGTRVHSNPDTQRMMAGGGGGELDVRVSFDRSGDRLADALLDALRVSVYNRFGSNLEAAFSYR